jgi:hypothetical protein
MYPRLNTNKLPYYYKCLSIIAGWTVFRGLYFANPRERESGTHTSGSSTGLYNLIVPLER